MMMLLLLWSKLRRYYTAKRIGEKGKKGRRITTDELQLCGGEKRNALGVATRPEG
jgi:hypothetical protein